MNDELFLCMISRTSQSLHNAKTALTFYCINLVLQFFSRKIFLDYLGSEVLGLNTTAQNLLGILNIAELGIGASVAYNLYKPIFNKNTNEINDIVSIQGWLYRRIAYFVILGSLILMLFFPLIFVKAQLPLWYTYGSFMALLTSSLLGYFVNYRQIVLSADQKEYKVTFCVKGGMAIKVLIQILAIRFLEYGYESWIAIEILSSFIISAALNKSIKKEYPWLHPSIKSGSVLRKRYPQIITKTKQLFFHKIAGFVMTQTSPLIIYAYASLSLVASYGNYMLIVMGITSLMNALSNSINAGVGNLVAEGNSYKIKNVFWKITFIRIWIAATICFTLYFLGESFISLWVGKDFIIPQSAFIVLILNMFISLTRTNDMFLSAYGLYQDIWAPLIEAVLNLGLSILFGYFWGLTGILLGVSTSLIVIVYCWKPYFLYKKGFKENIREYIFRYLKYLTALCISSFLCCSLIKIFFGEYNVVSYTQLVLQGLMTATLFAICSFCILYLSDKYPKILVKSLYNRFSQK